MDIKDICSAGGDILDAVADAVNRNDYKGLSENVTNTVNRVVSQVRQEASKGTYGNPTHQYAKTVYTRRGQAEYKRMQRRENSEYASIYKNDAQQAGKKDAMFTKAEIMAMPASITKRPSGRILGPIQMAWGILATSGFGITALVMMILAFAQSSSMAMILAVIFGVLTMLGVTDIVRGSRKISLVNRFYRYARLIGTRGYIAVEELAFQTGQRRDEVLRDLRRMMKKHMFPQGRLDQKQTTFMLTQDVYQQYLQTEQQNQEARAQGSRRSRNVSAGSGKRRLNAGRRRQTMETRRRGRS